MATDLNLSAVHHIVEDRKNLPGALLPILHEVQEVVGHVPAEAVAIIAQGLNLSRAEVHGVVTYYHHFRSEPAGRQVVQICRAEACQAMGAEALWKQACQHVGGPGTSADGSITLEAAYCLGLCASSPAMSVNDRVVARVTAARLQSVLNAAESAAGSAA